MTLKLLIEKIDAIDITGYPVKENLVMKKCQLIKNGLDTLSSGNESSDSIKEFIKRVYWLGYELGSNKGLEMSKYASQQIQFLREAQRIAPDEYNSIIK
jgi:hypothetical protein